MNPPPSPTSSLRVKRESTAFSLFSTSSRSKSIGIGFLPSSSARDRTPFIPDLDSSTPRLPDVSGRADIANYVMAEQLKTLLDTDDHPAPPASSPSDDIKAVSSPSLPFALPTGANGIGNRLLAEAFRREYSASANEDRKRAYSTMYTEEEEDRASRFSRAPSYAGSMISQSDRGGGRKKFRAESQPAQALILPGLGEGKQRNINGKSLYGGQDVGVGVIGSQAFLGDVSEGGEGMNQECDIPMPESGTDWRVRQIEGEEEGMKFMVGPHVVSLEEDLPPLAAEHPARVWNSILHSLPVELVPTVQWKYEKVMLDDDEDEEPMHICQLTLSLSPLHPAIASHPAFSQLPINRHTAEYVTAVAAIGGSKTWTGELKGVKTDATNSALVKCISSGAFEWLHNSSLDDPIHAITPARRRSESPADELPASSPLPAQPTSSASEETAINMPEQSWEVVPFVNRAIIVPADKPAANTPADPLPVEDVTPATQPVETDVGIKQSIQKVFRSLSDRTGATFALTVEWDQKSKAFIERLTIGMEARQQIFQANTKADTAAFGSAVLSAAKEHGLEAFLKEIETSHKASNSTSRHTQAGDGNGKAGGDIIEVPAMEKGDEADVLVDWVEQLKAFCRSNNLRFPSYAQQVEKLPNGEGVEFRATMRLEEDNFAACTAYNTILQARQEMARWVYCEHFGQHAVPLDYHTPDAGYRGRGGRGGNKRGKNRW